MATLLSWCLDLSFFAVLFTCWIGQIVTETTSSEFPAANPTEPNLLTTDATSDNTVTFTTISQGFAKLYSTVTDIDTVSPEVISASERNLMPTDGTTQPSIIPTSGPISACFCDITPGLCDINCCCDVIDCDIKDLSSVFTGCESEERYDACIEQWLMFRGNVDSTLITANDSLFCVRSKNGQLSDRQTVPVPSQLPEFEESFSFFQQGQSSSIITRTFYRVDDVILTSYVTSSILGVLRLPSPGATALCVNRNPAKFLRSLSLSCSRSVTPQSCLGDLSLSARSYFSEIHLLKAPVPQNVSVLDFTIPIRPLSEWPEPSIQSDVCLNVVSEVLYVVWYTSGGTITNVTVNVTLKNTDTDTNILQQHSIYYKLAKPPNSGRTTSVGLVPGVPVLGLFNNKSQPITIQGLSPGGECSSRLHARTPILFTHNYITGCTFSSPCRNCSDLRSQLFSILQGVSTPDLVAMNSGAQPDWTRLIVQDCVGTPPLEEPSEAGCLVPVSLSVQLLWAQRGLLSLPQSQILGAKFLFRCQVVKCPLPSPLAVMTEVTFSDATVYPEPPRGQAQN